MQSTIKTLLLNNPRLVLIAVMLTLLLFVGAGEVVAAEVPAEPPACSVEQSPVNASDPSFPGNVPDEYTC